MRTLDLVHMAAFTPTDALHLLGKMDRWSVDSANLGADIWQRHLSGRTGESFTNTTEFARAVVELVVQRSTSSLIEAIAVSEVFKVPNSGLNEYLLNRAVGSEQSRLLDVKLHIAGVLAVVGAPARSIYPQVAKRLNTKVNIAEYHEIGNAVGAAIGTVMQRVSSLITSPAEGIYRAHTPSGIQDYDNLDDAADAATKELEDLANQRAAVSKAANVDTSAQRSDVIVQGLGGYSIFIESRITVTVQGDVDVRVQPG